MAWACRIYARRIAGTHHWHNRRQAQPKENFLSCTVRRVCLFYFVDVLRVDKPNIGRTNLCHRSLVRCVACVPIAGVASHRGNDCSFRGLAPRHCFLQRYMDRCGYFGPRRQWLFVCSRSSSCIWSGGNSHCWRHVFPLVSEVASSGRTSSSPRASNTSRCC